MPGKQANTSNEVIVPSPSPREIATLQREVRTLAHERGALILAHN
jgi:hypothetical protein